MLEICNRLELTNRRVQGIDTSEGITKQLSFFVSGKGSHGNSCAV